MKNKIKAALATYFDNDTIESDIQDWREDVVAELNAREQNRTRIHTNAYQYYNFRHAAHDAKAQDLTAVNAIVRAADIRKEYAAQTKKFLAKVYGEHIK